jgi:hypothetical protein
MKRWCNIALLVLYRTKADVSSPMAFFMNIFQQSCGSASFLCGSGSGKNFDAVPAPAPTLLHGRPTFWKRTKVNHRALWILYDWNRFINMNGRSKKLW